jgi:hypothetical protein
MFFRKANALITISIDNILKMKSIFTIMLFGLSSFLFSQNIKNLDSKNGFKSLKLGTHFNSFEGQGLKWSTTNESQKVRVFYFDKTADELLTVFNTKFANLYLCFDFQDNLVALFLEKEYSSNVDGGSLGAASKDWERVVDSYVSVIGLSDYNVDENSDSRLLTGLGWVGSKVRLEVNITYFGFNTGSSLRVQYWSEKYYNQLRESGY